MSKKVKIIIAFICLAVGLVNHFYYQSKFVIIDEEITDFFSGLLCGAGGSILLVNIFRKEKESQTSGVLPKVK